MRISVHGFAVLGVLLLLAPSSTGQPRYRVCVPRADLTGKRLESQLLYGEHVVRHEQKDGLWRVEAVDQPEFNHNDRWEGYPGWIRPDAVTPARVKGAAKWVLRSRKADVHREPSHTSDVVISLWFGTRLAGSGDPVRDWIPVRLVDGSQAWIRDRDLRPLNRKIPSPELRRQIVDDARIFLGRPYLWGGRSPEAADCSGLVNLAYRSSGVDIPRDAHEQHLRARRIKRNELKPGDLIFTARTRIPRRVTHVLLYAGEARVIEAVRSGIRETSFAKSLGAPLEKVVPGKPVRGKLITFGRYLP